MKRALIVTIGIHLLTPAAAAVTAGPAAVDSHVRSQAPGELVTRAAQPEALEAGHFEQAVDHSGRLAGQTFSQRYWLDSEFASGPDAPVLYHVCGESDVDQAYFLNDQALEWAKTLGARVVFLEHRYYGPSQPFSDLSNQHLQYLTLDNVIEDLASFQKWTSATQGWTGKWIALGGSYSATVAALYRQRHPELVVGALASSAPMISGVGQAVGTQDDVSSLSSTDSSAGGMERPWAYQACTSLGYWQAEGAERGSPLDLPSSWLCKQVFGDIALYDSVAYNKAYDAPFLENAAGAPSNILFTYGSEDVWTDIGLATQTNANPKITIRVLEGAGHHFDLNASDGSDSAAVKDARDAFTALARTWLKG